MVKPETSANIGAICRAMASCDLSDLRIVGKRSDYDEKAISRLALKAFPLWSSARFFTPSNEGLREALQDTQISFATTRRTGKKRSQNFYELEPCVKDIFEKKYFKVAFVFGNERTGLSDEELLACNASIYIPTSKNFGSLNLSQAVQIVAYELFKAAIKNKEASPEKTKPQNISYANLNDINTISEKLIHCLLRLQFFQAGGAKENENFFANILARAELNSFEAEHIVKLIEKLDAKIKYKVNQNAE